MINKKDQSDPIDNLEYEKVLEEEIINSYESKFQKETEQDFKKNKFYRLKRTPLEIINVYGLDPLRYYLLKEVSFGNDGNISEEKLENCINSDLANNFGNLCQRVLSFAEKNCSSLIPDHKYNDEDLEILKPLNNLDKIRSFIDNQDINQYMSFIVDRLFAANKYFNDQEPWKKKDDRLRLNTIVYTALELIRKVTVLLYPVMPETSVKVLNVFNETENSIDFTSIDNNEILKKDLKINKLDILFKKIEKW